MDPEGSYGDLREETGYMPVASATPVLAVNDNTLTPMVPVRMMNGEQDDTEDMTSSVLMVPQEPVGEVWAGSMINYKTSGVNDHEDHEDVPPPPQEDNHAS